jgi:crotonobetainyl-CoA:carnitine CoA-transferase CaiB-like acyl-CoA transferase
MGLSYEALRTNNPRLIYCSLKGFLAGPYEHRAALDEVVQMMGGLAYMTGPPGRPLRAGAPVNDMMGGMFAAIAIMAAVIERARTGRGQLVRSALFENNIWLVAPHMAQYAVTGQAPNPMPARISAWAVYDVFDTADEQPIFVGVVTDTQWNAFCTEFNRPDLLSDASLKTNPQRVAARERFMPELRAIFKRLTRAEAASRCERIGLPFAPVMRPQDLFDDPQLAQRGAMTKVTLPTGKTVPIPALPIEMNGQRLGQRLDAPRAGEHSEAIARELGLDQAEIKALIDENVISVDSGS